LQAQERLTTETIALDAKRSALADEATRLDSARAVLRRRINFFTDARAHLEEAEAQSHRTRAEKARDVAKLALRLVGMAELLGDLHRQESEVKALQDAVSAEQEKARPEREALERLGAEFKSALEAEAAGAKLRLDEAQGKRGRLRG